MSFSATKSTPARTDTGSHVRTVITCGKAGDSKPEACGNCHEPDSEDPVKRSDAFHLQCKGCHEEYGAGAVNCSECHVL